jgi:RNA polymerase sigma factor (sigma-70 family)
MSRRRSERELWNAIGQDDQSAFAELGDRLRRCVHWVLNRTPARRELSGEVEDIVADARLRLEQLRERGFTGGDQEFKTYLYKVVVSACADAGHQHRWTASLDAPIALADGDERPLGDVVEAMVDPALSVDVELEHDETRAHVRQALERLDERCRTLLRRFHLEGTPVREIARRENVRANTLEVALMRCRSRLYAAFLSVYADAGDPAWKERVTTAARMLSAERGTIFNAWWVENRSVTDIAKEIGISPARTRERLADAKYEVWQRVTARSAV